MCPTYFNRGGDIFLYNNGQLTYLGSGSNGTVYQDIALLGGKLYARNTGGILHIYDINGTTVTQTGTINNFIGFGTCLGADNQYLYLDDSGTIYQIDPVALTKTAVATNVPPAQGDILPLADGTLMISVLDNGVSKIQTYKSGVLTNSYTVTKSTGGNLMSIFGFFIDQYSQIWLLTSDGSVYYFDPATQIATFTDKPIAPGPGSTDTWNGAAQAFDCYAPIIPPPPPPTDDGGTQPIPTEPVTPDVSCSVDTTTIKEKEQAPPSSLYRNKKRGVCNCRENDLLCLIEWFTYRQAYHELNNLRFGFQQYIKYEVVEDLNIYKEIITRMKNGVVFDVPYHTIQSRIKTLLKS